MDWTNVVIALISVGTGIGAIIGYFNKRFREISAQIGEISKDLRGLDSRLSRMEGYIERDLVEKYRPYRTTGTEEK